MAGPIIGGWLANHYDYTFVFMIACTLCVFAFLIVTFFFKHDALLPPSSITKQSKKKNMTSPFSSLWVLLLLISFIQIAKMAPISYFTIFVEQEISSDKLIIGLLYASSGLTLMISAPLWGQLLDRRPGFIIVAALMAAMGIAAQAWAQSILACLLARLWWGACLGAFLPFLIAQVSLLRSKNTQGKLIGFSHSAIKFGGAMGVLLGGLLASKLGERYSFLCIGGLYLGIACIFIHQLLLTKKIKTLNL